MIALVAYQFAAFGRSRAWLVLLVGYLAYLLLFFLRIAHHQPGSYADPMPAVLAIGAGLAWTLAAGQDRALWQLLIVAAGSRNRALSARVAVPFGLVVPLAVATALVAAEHRLAGGLAPVLGAVLLYLVIGLIGCLAGSLGGWTLSVRSVPPAIVAVFAVLLLAL
ncbi:MAG TPA: hypothetical protein VH298_09095 [Jatrophihabitans sp.]|nr:hypothetical protein [Jatrophihabitans sp.]